MWTFRQLTGELVANDGHVVAVGYSGHDEGVNNPALQAVHSVGPIPAGLWDVVGPPDMSGRHGPYVLRLLPRADTEVFGRGGFLVHGDSLEHPGQASLGCVVLPRAVRELVWTSGDHLLLVVTGVPDASTVA